MSGPYMNSQGANRGKSAYVVPFRVVMESIGVTLNPPPPEVRLSEANLTTLIKSLLRGISVDEAWYRRTYPDVEQAIKDGTFRSAKHHFVEEGYFEGRRPGAVVVDEHWYMSTYQDVAEGIEAGDLASCQEHFEMHGEAEGRLPREY